MKKLSIFALLCSLSLFFVAALVPSYAQEQQATPVQCGDIVEGEFTENAQYHEYIIQIQAGQHLNIQGDQLGETLQYVITLYDATGRIMTGTNYIWEQYGSRGYLAQLSPLLESGTLASNSPHTIRVSNSAIGVEGNISENSGYFGGIGVYVLNIGCTMRDGTVIEPGSSAPPNKATTEEGNQVPTVSGPDAVPSTLGFSGVGFPGLAPVDFSSIIKVPFNTDAPNPASFAPTVSNVLGFTVDAEAGDSFGLSYQRLEGNLNLGLVVLSPDNEVFFQASLVTSEVLSTRFTLPTAGQYTIGIFRIDMVEVSDPVETRIELSGQLNP